MAQETVVAGIDPVLQAMGKIPSGVFVLTTGAAGATQAVGTLVSFVQQVSMQPLYLMIAVKKSRALHAALSSPAAGGGGQNVKRFVINIAAASDKALLKKYAAAEHSGNEAFAGVPHKLLASGQTVLTDACAYLECELVKIVDVGADHDLFIGRPVGGELLGEPNRKPAVHLRHDGSKY
ncbi:MAG: flavin reductase family protein [Phycisphaerae bacterium]